MGCNAWNHAPDCNCGWGGEFYGWGHSRDHWRQLTSYTTPNAHCQYCNAPVYFYRSPFGGSVYFDELGPPWPKHDCGGVSRLAKPLQLNIPPPKRTHGWRPLLCQEISHHTTLKCLCRLKVLSDTGNPVLLHAAAEKTSLNATSPFMAKQSYFGGAFEISTLNCDDAGHSELRFWAAADLDQLVARLSAQSLKAFSANSELQISDPERLIRKIACGNFQEFEVLCSKALGRPVSFVMRREDVGPARRQMSQDHFRDIGKDLERELIDRTSTLSGSAVNAAQVAHIDLLRELIELHRRSEVARVWQIASDAKRRAATKKQDSS